MAKVVEKHNARLGKALKAAKQSPKKRGFTAAFASKIRRKWLAEQKFVPTQTMRIHKDAIELAKAAWPKCNERVRKCSEAVRKSAHQALGL